MLPETLHGRLREVDRVRGEEPEVRHVLEDQDLDAVVDLLTLLRVERAASLLEQAVELGDAPAVPVLALRGMERAEERGVRVGIARRRVHRQVEVPREPALDPHGVLDVLDLRGDAAPPAPPAPAGSPPPPPAGPPACGATGPGARGAGAQLPRRPSTRAPQADRACRSASRCR